jgi:dihydroxyacid dehydratase/phosphogluconate dehydratase
MDAKTDIKKRLPSRHVTEGPERAPHRSYLYAMGLTTHQIHQPFVGVASCWNEAAPCNISLMRQAQAVKKGVAAAGGTPREFCTITVTDRNNQTHTTVIYNMPRTSDSAMQYDRQGNPLPYDSDHFFATINNGNDFVIVQEFHMGRLFKKIAFFIAPSKPGAR